PWAGIRSKSTSGSPNAAKTAPSDTGIWRVSTMQVISVISTKGGVGKTTIAANLGGLAADAGLRVLLVDLDVQPTLSSYFSLNQQAVGGIYELLAFNEQVPEQVISRTAVHGLDLIVSND